MAVSMVVLLGFVGLAIDVGMLMVTRNEMQNAADAAALAGAGGMYKNQAGTYDPSRTSPGQRTRPPKPSPTTRR